MFKKSSVVDGATDVRQRGLKQVLRQEEDATSCVEGLVRCQVQDGKWREHSSKQVLLTIDNFPNSRFLVKFLPGVSSKCHPVVAFAPAPAFKTWNSAKELRSILFSKLSFLKSWFKKMCEPTIRIHSTGLKSTLTVASSMHWFIIYT